MKSLYLTLVLLILLTGCSTLLTTEQGGASTGPIVGHRVAAKISTNRDQDLESSRGRLSD